MGNHRRRIVLVSSDWHGWMALQGLQGLSDVQVVGVITAPPRLAPATVGYLSFARLAPTLPVLETEEINSPHIYRAVYDWKPDLLLVVGWGQLLGEDWISLPDCQKVGFHPTLLPKHRGRAPIPWTLIHDVRRSAVSFFGLESGADTGLVVLQIPFFVPADATAGSLYRTVGRTVRAAMPELMRRLVVLDGGQPQDPFRSSLWTRRRPTDGLIDWNQSEWALYNWVRGLTFPYPGAFTFWRNQKLIVWQSIRTELVSNSEPGTVLTVGPSGVCVATGDGVLTLTVVQLAGARPERAVSWAIRQGVSEGEVLG